MRAVANALLAVAALLLLLVLILAAFGLPVFASLKLIFEGSLQSDAGRARTLVKATPLLLAGLGMVVAWRAGMYNIGGEGQLLIGIALGAAFAKLLPGLPPAVLCYGILVMTAIGGGAYAWLAGWLQIRRGVQAVISTILLNFVAIQVIAFLVRGPLQEAKKQLPQTDPLPEAAMMARFSTSNDLHAGVFWSVIVAVAVFIWMFRTVSGFQTRVVGSSPRLARAQRLNVPQLQLRAMALSGALCGLAGGIEYVGIAGQVADSSAQGWGFLAIPVALLGGLHPLGAILSATYFGALFAGTEYMARFTPAANSLIYVIQAVAVLGFLVGSWWWKRNPKVTDDV